MIHCESRCSLLSPPWPWSAGPTAPSKVRRDHAVAEGFGASASAEEASFSVVPLATDGEEALSVVVLQGTTHRAAIPTDLTLVAFVPVLPDVRFVVDDRGAQTPTTGADGDQQRASLDVGVPLEPGPHSLTVVLTTFEGEVATSTARYQVEA